jgi:peptidoglycan/LPS O-acetylase OafA/YrhL
MGPNITAMLAVWAIGVAVFEWYERVRIRGAAWTAALCAAALLVGAWQARALYDVAWAVSLELIRTGFGVIHVSRGRIHPWLLIGAGAFTVVLVMLIALAKINDQRRVVRVEPLLPYARRLGEFTFPLYLCHFPIFVVLGAWGGYDRTNRLVTWSLCGLVFVAIFFLVVPATDWCKKVMRRGLMRLLPAAGTTSPASPA